MIIEKLNIKAFGKVKNLEINLEKGFNIIYGENEKGKSTIQNFIRVMLYGMTLNKKNLKDNDRKRFTPWSKEKPSGEIFIKNNEEEILIKREFGSTKREDVSLIIDNITGKEIKIDKISPGKDLMGISVNGFLKTLFISQLALGIYKDKDDEIIHKLSNLENLNHDDVSYQTAVKILEEYKKTWISQRKGGKLNDLREKLDSLNSEYIEAINLNKENIEDNIKLNETKNKKELIIKDLKALELYKKHIKKLKLKKEYKDIIKYLKKTKELKNVRGKVQEQLGDNNEKLNEEFLQKLCNEYYYYNELKIINDKLKEKYNFLLVEETELKFKLNEYQCFSTLDDDVDVKVKSLIEKRELLKKAFIQYEEIEKQTQEIQDELNKIKIKKDGFKSILSIRDKANDGLLIYEEKLRELKYFLSSNIIDYNVLDKEELINNKVKLYKIITILTLVLLIASGVATFIMSSMKPIITGIVTALLFWYSTLKGNKLSLEKNIINIEKNKQNKLNQINKEIEEIEQDLNEFASSVNAKDFKNMFLKIKEYDDLEINENNLKIKLENKILIGNNEEIKNNLIKNEKFIEFILKHTQSNDESDFLEKSNRYKVLANNYSNLKKELNEKEEVLNSQEVELNEKIKSIKYKLESLNKNHVALENIENEINDLWEKLKIKNSIEKELYQVENSYKLLLKDRDLEDIKNEIKEIAEIDFDENFENEEEIEQSYKVKNNELVQIEKQLKDIENLINNRFLGKRNAWEIMQDIIEIKEEILKGEEEVEILEIALENLKLSFKEVQKNFGPKLNKRVREIFKEITDEAYHDVKVGDDYGMMVRDNQSHELIDVQSLSNGCEDQLYFSLRIGLIDMLFNKNEIVPIILDESFVQYDNKRLEKVLNFLYDYSKHKQIILFTCQKREIDITNKFNNINVICL